MPCILTSVHDPVALSATCEQLRLPAPREGSFWYEGQEAFGWVVRLPGPRFPIVCDTLRGLVAYHPLDNAHDRYAPIMRFILAYYAVRARLRHRGTTGQDEHRLLASMKEGV
jgi:hypothetical protein